MIRLGCTLSNIGGENLFSSQSQLLLAGFRRCLPTVWRDIRRSNPSIFEHRPFIPYFGGQNEWNGPLSVVAERTLHAANHGLLPVGARLKREIPTCNALAANDHLDAHVLNHCHLYQSRNGSRFIIRTRCYVRLSSVNSPVGS